MVFFSYIFLFLWVGKIHGFLVPPSLLSLWATHKAKRGWCMSILRIRFQILERETWGWHLPNNCLFGRYIPFTELENTNNICFWKEIKYSTTILIELHHVQPPNWLSPASSVGPQYESLDGECNNHLNGAFLSSRETVDGVHTKFSLSPARMGSNSYDVTI